MAGDRARECIHGGKRFRVLLPLGYWRIKLQSATYPGRGWSGSAGFAGAAVLGAALGLVDVQAGYQGIGLFGFGLQGALLLVSTHVGYSISITH